jgi:hypothetical protein
VITIFTTEKQFAKKDYDRMKPAHILSEAKLLYDQSGLNAIIEFITTTLMEGGRRHVVLDEVIGMTIHFRQLLISLECVLRDSGAQ